MKKMHSRLVHATKTTAHVGLDWSQACWRGMQRRKWLMVSLLICCLYILGGQPRQAAALVRKYQAVLWNKQTAGRLYDFFAAGTGMPPQNPARATDRQRRGKTQVKQLPPELAAKLAAMAPSAPTGGGDTQATATCIGALPYMDSGTTVGATDDYNLPSDTTNPTMTGSCATIFTGAGPAGSLPHGAVYTGTGTAPDVVYAMSFPSGNPDTLTITMDPTGAQDLSLIVYCNNVSSNPADAIVIDDTGVGGTAETVTIGNIAAGTTLYVVVDGYSTGGTPPGPSGAYTLSVTSSGATQPSGTCSGGGTSADLAITKTDGITTAAPGGSTTYTITASNAGPDPVASGTVTDTFPATLTCTWTCVGAGGGTCTAAGAGNINDSVNLPAGGSVTYTASCSISPSATGMLVNTATVSSGVTDPNPANNSATDTDSLSPPCMITCPANITQSSDPNQCGAVVTYSPPTTSGACGTVTCMPSSGSFFPVGMTTVNCSDGGVGSCSFTVTVNDTQPPAINCPTNVTVANDPNQCGAVVNYPAPVVTDNCPGAPAAICNPPSGSFFPVGTTAVNCTVGAGMPARPNGGIGCSTITQSSSQAITALNSISCNNTVNGHTDNSYYRAFTLPTFGINTPFNVQSIDIGIEDATSGSGMRPSGGRTSSISKNSKTRVANGPSAAGQPLTVNLYTSNQPFPTGFPGSLSLIGTASVMVTDQSGTILNVPVTGAVAAGAQLVVEVFTPDGQAAGNFFFIGSNGAGQSGPSYIRAPDCGVTTPTTTAALGSPEMQIVMNVNGCEGAPTAASCSFNVTVTNPPPVLTYNAQTVPAGTTPTINPATGPTDNGPVSVQLQSIVPATGLTATVNSATGQVQVTSATLMGNYVVTLVATDNCNVTTTTTLAITVACPTITLTPNLANGIQGTAYSQSVTAGPPGTTYTYAVTTNVLPPGLSLNPATGLISGTPSAAGNYAFNITATGWGGCTKTQSYNLLITGTCDTITVSPTSLPGGTLGTAYSAPSVSATGGVVPHTFAITQGNLPGGLTLNATTGAITGTPTAVGTFSFRVTATAVGGCTGSRVYVISVACSTLTFSPAGASMPDGVKSVAYNQAITVTPMASYTFSLLLGQLPLGYTMNSAGVISGITNQTGTWTFTVKAQTGSCQATKQYTLTVQNSGSAALGLINDYDGDGKSDMALHGANGEWRIQRSSDQRAQTQFWGTTGDVSLNGDYDGDGRTDLAVFRPDNGTWYVKRSSDGGSLVKVWGQVTDVPVPGDYDGDGQTDLAVFRPSDGRWYVLRSSDQQNEVTAWGAGYAPYNDVPVTGDYDGDGQTDLAVFRRASGTWLVKRSSDGQSLVKQWGLGTDVPVAADYDGDGQTDLAVWRLGVWYIWQSTSASVRVEAWGASGAPYFDQAVPGDYDGDGQADVAVWRASDQTWYVRCSQNGNVMTQPQGQAGDRAVRGK